VTSNFFTIAGHHVVINFCESEVNNMGLLPSFAPFRSEQPAEEPPLFSLTVDDSLQPEKKRTLIRRFDTGNGETVVYLLPDGGYQFIIKDIYNQECGLLICHNRFTECYCALNGNWTMRSFGLNDALMLIYAFAGAYHDTLLIHASCIGYKGKGYPFIAQSGTGKSTHSSLWMKHIEGCELMNDDNPIVRIINGKPFIYGSPWSGKTPCYRNIKAELGAVVQIARAPKNYIERLPVVQAFATLLPACSSMKWDETLHDRLCNILSAIIATTPIYIMHCLPDEEAARVCHQAVTCPQKEPTESPVAL
jgi:hypothetical protein